MSILLGDCSFSHLDMAPIIPSFANNVSFIPGVAFTAKRNNFLTRCSINRKLNKQTLPAQRYTVPLSTSIQLFPQFWIGSILKPKLRTQIASTSGTDIAVEEANLSASDGEPSVAEVDGGEISGESSSKSDVSPIKSKRSRPVRKSDMPPVKNEDLIPGATFTGKVRSIQPFGAFVDFGAFTDGLVHVSRLSDSFVKDVASVVKVGQEVTVRLIEANMETGRISLSMRESDDPNKVQQQRDAPVSSDKSRPPRKIGHRVNQKKEDSKKTSKFIKGQDLEGTVKNLARAGAFISLPEGEEGFLPTSEEADEGFGNIMGGSSLEIGQEVSVRVLRITRGQVTLTMKKEEDFGELDAKLSQGVVHTATNPFVLAFRSNQVISAFLDERERENENELVKKVGKDTETVVSTTDDTLSKTLDEEEDLETPPDDSKTKDDESGSGKEVEASSVIIGSGGSPPTKDEITQEPSPAETEENKEAELSGKLVNLSSETVKEASEKAFDNAILKDDLQSQKSDMEDSAVPQSDSDESGNPLSATKNEGKPHLSGELTHQSLSDVVEEVSPKAGNDIISKDVEAKENKVEDEISGKVADPLSKNVELAKEVEVDNSVVKHEVESQKPDTAVSFVSEGGSEESGDPLSATENEGKPHLSGHLTDQTVADVEEITPKMGNDIASDVEAKENKETGISGAEFSSDIVELSEARAISDAMVKDELRTHNADATVFSAPQSDSEVPEDPLPATGNAVEPHFAESLINAEVGDNQGDNNVNEGEKQASAATSQNGTASDPSGQSNDSSTKETTKAAVSPALVKQLREESGAGMMDCKRALSETGGDIVKAQEYLRKKGLASAEKKASRVTAEGRIGSYIHDGRIGVLIEVNCETDFVARGDIFRELVEDLAMQVAAYPQVQYLNTEDVPNEIADKEREIEMQKEDLLSKPEQIRSKIVDGRIRKRLEELALLEQPFIKDDKIMVKDWVKQTISTIGENIKVRRFVRYNLGEGLEKKSQDFAAEVAAQTAAKPISTSVKQASDTKEPVEESPKPVVSATLVKQLREETGAGMMDCKKALSETGGDLQKAQEYLRKKGLSTADKKSSRLAAEGRIGSYIHDSRIGVIIEVNCETDFVARAQNFKDLVDDLAMQVVACPQVQYVSIDDIPEDIVNKEKQLEMQREDLQSKPENIREKIVDGRVTKRLGELALLEQPFIRNDRMLVKDLVKQTVAALGENIKVRRFVRFTLGETSDAKLEEEA